MRSFSIPFSLLGCLVLFACSGSSGPTSTGEPSSDGTSSSSETSNTPSSGTTCEKSSDCPALDCSCSDGSATSYQGCDDGVCVTACPSPDVGAGGDCVVPGGCFCASTVCGFSSNTCCASAGTVPSQGNCSSDCDCQSGTCSLGQCF